MPYLIYTQARVTDPKFAPKSRIAVHCTVCHEEGASIVCNGSPALPVTWQLARADYSPELEDDDAIAWRGAGCTGTVAVMHDVVIPAVQLDGDSQLEEVTLVPQGSSRINGRTTLRTDISAEPRSAVITRPLYSKAGDSPINVTWAKALHVAPDIVLSDVTDIYFKGRPDDDRLDELPRVQVRCYVITNMSRRAAARAGAITNMP